MNKYEVVTQDGRNVTIEADYFEKNDSGNTVFYITKIYHEKSWWKKYSVHTVVAEIRNPISIIKRV